MFTKFENDKDEYKQYIEEVYDKILQEEYYNRHKLECDLQELINSGYQDYKTNYYIGIKMIMSDERIKELYKIYKDSIKYKVLGEYIEEFKNLKNNYKYKNSTNSTSITERIYKYDMYKKFICLLTYDIFKDNLYEEYKYLFKDKDFNESKFLEQSMIDKNMVKNILKNNGYDL